MRSRIPKKKGNEIIYTANADNLIERLKKIRALNCDPSDVGMNAFILKDLPLYMMNRLMRF